MARTNTEKVSFYKQMFEGIDDADKSLLAKNKDERDQAYIDTVNKKTLNDVLLQNAAEDRKAEEFLAGARGRALAAQQAGISGEDLAAGRGTSLNQQAYDRAATEAKLTWQNKLLPDSAAATEAQAQAKIAAAVAQAKIDKASAEAQGATPEYNEVVQRDVARLRAIGVPIADIVSRYPESMRERIQAISDKLPGAAGVATQVDPVGQAVRSNDAATKLQAELVGTTFKTDELIRANTSKVEATTTGKLATDAAKATTGKPAPATPFSGPITNANPKNVPTAVAPAAPLAAPAVTQAVAPVAVTQPAPAVVPAKPAPTGINISAMQDEIAVLRAKQPAYNGRNPAPYKAWLAGPEGQRLLTLENLMPRESADLRTMLGRM